jgi:hypothetical protein
VKTIADWLAQHRAEVVAELVERICAALPDYRQRPADQLAGAAGAAYDQWCDTVLSNDLMRHAQEAEAVIIQNIARGTDPNQLARIPEFICAVVLARLAQAESAVDPAELARFRHRAEHMTATILGIGSLRIARATLQKTVGDSIVPDLSLSGDS